MILNCNRCDRKFESKHPQNIEFFRGEARSHPLEFCPHCGCFDSHYIFKNNQKEEE